MSTDRARAIYTNFGNASSGWWDLGLTFASTIGPTIKTYNDDLTIKNESSHFGPNVYLTGALNVLRRPKLPWSPRSVGLALGTNLTRGSLLDEVVTALTVGRLVREFGLVAGASWLTVTTVEEAPPRATTTAPSYRFRHKALMPAPHKWLADPVA